MDVSQKYKIGDVLAASFNGKLLKFMIFSYEKDDFGVYRYYVFGGFSIHPLQETDEFLMRTYYTISGEGADGYTKL